MSRTHRKHLPMTKLAKRGGSGPDRAEGLRPAAKTIKQRRVNERVAVRREWR